MRFLFCFLSWFLLGCILLVGCGGKEKAFVDLDYTKAESWKYLIGSDIYGLVASQDSQQSYSGSFRAYLEGIEGSNDGQMQFRMKDVKVVAGFLNDDELTSLQKRLAELTVSLSQSEGVKISDTLDIPAIPAGGWDVLRSVARVLPVLPGAEMAVGSSWEREQQFPLHLKQGSATGLLYQVFRLDSITHPTAGKTCAALSWVFTYRVSLQNDSIPLARSVPLSGSGLGNAIVDVDQKLILKSKASLQMSHAGDSHIEFSETVHLENIQ